MNIRMPVAPPSAESSKATQLPIYDSGGIRHRSVFELKELFRYRFLLRNLISRDLKVRYKRSVLGFIWVMLNPLLTMAVITIVFSQLLRFQIVHYPAFLLSGILIWNLYSQGSAAAMSNLIGNGAVLRRMYVPPSIFVASAIGSALVNFVFSIGPFCLLAYISGVTPSLTWLFMLVPAALTTLFTLGVGLIISALMVFFNDIFEIYTVLLNVYMYLTPLFYPASILPEPLRSAERFNPMFIFIDMARAAVLDGRLADPMQITLGLAMALAAFAIGWLLFTRLERRFVYYF